MTTLIVGATGMLGHATALALLQDGQRVRALARDPARAADLARAGAEVVPGDLTDPDSLERACKGAHRVLACAHALLGKGDNASAQVDHVGHSALIAAARGAGVARFVYTSMRGASEDHPIDFARTKHEIEQVLRESGLPFLILRPTAFMEQHVHLFIGKPLLDRGFTVLLGPGTKPRNFVALRDIVPIAVRALMDEGLAGRTIEVGGPENLSNREVALLYSLRARKGRIVHLPLGVVRVAAAAVRPFHEGIARVLDLALLPDDAWPETYEPRAQLAEFPARLTTVDQFVDERVREWRRAGMGRRR
jgi:NADH dehydrogenase